VLNDGEGVLLEAQGERLAEFVAAIRGEAPPLSRIDAIETENIPGAAGESLFSIRESAETKVTTAIVPDAATCDVCLHEATDPTDRRFGYPFLNCTHCGPRYTITRKLPYDRKETSMAVFPMCPACEHEYHNPLDRRFHAQPTACPVCGPQLSEPIARVMERIAAGEIVALKGLGGFHLVCDARNETAVSTLRRRKNRDAKPFAVMVANLASARNVVSVDHTAEELLTGTIRPIVVLPRRADAPALAPSLAPGMSTLGVMLPYTPLHQLLFHVALGAPSFETFQATPSDLVLVMTSANPGGEPLVIGNDEAQKRLSSIADTVVTHNRDIIIRVDDSVTMPFEGAPYFIRRARGYTPQAIKLPHAVPPVLAFGADLKNTICVTRGDEAFVSQHIGDLDNRSTVAFLHETVDHLLGILKVQPEMVATDLHPDFLSTAAAKRFAVPRLPVQHHHAHIAALVAEHRLTEPVLGVALDGFGLGSDGGAWGGEILLVEGTTFKRLGHLYPLAQPGGDKASQEPWRMAASALHALCRGDEIAGRFSTITAAGMMNTLLASPLGSNRTSSCGRLFDAACGLLGLQVVSEFEGQAPMMLESLVTTPAVLNNGFELLPNGVLSLLPLLDHLANCPDQSEGANLFHGTLVEALAAWIEAACRTTGIQTVALSGGCFLNRRLLTGLSAALRAKEHSVYIHRQTPPGDGCISLGQAWVAALTAKGD
jgi:hydrogenase maturation protein HypF